MNWWYLVALAKYFGADKHDYTSELHHWEGQVGGGGGHHWEGQVGDHHREGQVGGHHREG